MSAAFLARLMLSVLAGAQGLAPLAIDLNRTHAANPLWLGHARFHVVWQTLTEFLAAIVAVALIWWRGPGVSSRFYLAAILTSLSMLAFTAAVVSRRVYGGTLHDPNGIRPVPIRLGGKTLQVDMNGVAVAAGLAVLTTAVLLFHSHS